MRKLCWQEYILIAIIIVFVSVQIGWQSSLKSLPAPGYGGDLYYEMGAVNHVKYGGNPFVSSSNSEPFSHYFPGYAGVVGGMARITGMNAFTAMKVFSWISVALAIIIAYFLILVLFNNKTIALAGTIIFNPFSALRLLKYTDFGYQVFFPLIVLLTLLFIKKRHDKNYYWYAVFLGISWGLGSLTHGTIFLTGMMMFPLIYLYLIFIPFDKKRIIPNTIAMGTVMLIGLMIALLQWGTLIKYKMNFPFNFTALSQPSYNLGFIWPVLQKTIFNFSNTFNGIISFLVICGLILLITLKKSTERSRFIWLVLTLTVILPMHFLITMPLFGTDFAPAYMVTFLAPIARVLLACFALWGSLILFSKNQKIQTGFIMGLIAILLIVSGISFNSYLHNDKWIQAGRRELPTHYLEAQEWINENTNVSDVIISAKELMFLINALTGRKTIAFPSGHISLINDRPNREMAQTLLLYSNNDDIREKIIKKYKVKYLYWNKEWISTEYQTINGDINPFDPLEIQDTPNNRFVLKMAGIRFEPAHTTISPNKRGDDRILKLDMLLILPSGSEGHPWNKKLDKYLKLEKEFYQDGEVYGKIYKFID